MKLLAAVISSALAAREPDAERRLEKITARATELNAFVQSYDEANERQKTGVEKWVNRLLDDLNSIDTSKCPDPAEEDKFADEIDTIEDLCDGAGKVPSMMRSYARKFGCVEGFPKRRFLEKVIKRSHKLKKVANRAGKCEQVPKPTEPVVTDPPATDPPASSLCAPDRWADCSSLSNTEIFFENEWTCRNCFRIRAYYGTNGSFKFNPANGDFVKIKFTEKVYFTETWSHPISSVGEIGDDNTWKMNFKNNANFISGMMFDAELITADADLWVDGQWIIDGAESCRCRSGPEPTDDPPCSDPCNGVEDCQTFVNSCAIKPSQSNTIASTSGSAGFKVSAEVKCGSFNENAHENIVHINAGGQWDVFGDRYFALFAMSDGDLKFNAPLKGKGKDMVTVRPNCTEGTWNTYTVEQTYVDGVDDALELTLSVDDQVLKTFALNVEDAYTGDLNVDVSNSFHPAADSFKVRNFYQQTFSAPEECVPEDPCAGRDNCDTLVNSCSIKPQYNHQIGTVEGNAEYSASVDVFCRRTEDHTWQSVVHMTQGGYRDEFGDRYFTIWQRDDGMLKINAPLKGNTQFDEVEYFVSCDDNSWTNIAVKQVAIEGGLLELSVFQDGNKLGSNRLHHSDAFVGQIDVFAGNSWFDPASFFKIKNFIHSSKAYIAPPCAGTDPCADLENCATYVDSCAIAPYRGNRLAEAAGTLGFKISAEVRCTDRIAETWENVLHVHSGTNRENFGDRFFTIWKEADKTDGLRIVAPVFNNPHFELNAYVSCSPGWHTFTVQQTEATRQNMLVEILMDGVVVESQEVRKDDTYQGELFVEASNAFVWPAAYDHLVRNFYQQDITCMDPCAGEDNCETFIDSCAINPSKNNQLSKVIAAVNHVTSVDVLCTDMDSEGEWMSLAQLSTLSLDGNPGNRFFKILRHKDNFDISFSWANPEDFKYYSHADDTIPCPAGEWRTFKLEQRQDASDPALTNIEVSVDDVRVASRVVATQRVLKGDEVKVYASNKWNKAATEYSLRNYYYQTFAEVDYEPCVHRDQCASIMMADQKDCTTFVDSCEMRPSRANKIASVNAEINHITTADVRCSHDMALGDYTSILQMTSENLDGNIGQRFFKILRKNDSQQLQLSVANSEVSHMWSRSGYVDCIPGEWQTWSVEQLQNAENPTVTDITIKLDGDVLFETSVPTDGVFVDENVNVYLSNRWNDAGSAYAVRNFYYRTFHRVATDPCENRDDCTTFVNAAPAAPVKDNQITTVRAAVNHVTAVDILCSDAHAVDTYYNILHMTTGGWHDTYGDRFLAIWRNNVDQRLLINVAMPNGNTGNTGLYWTCTPGEWNTYSLEQSQRDDAPHVTIGKIYIDGVKVHEFSMDTKDVLKDADVKVFASNSVNTAADAFQIKNFFYQTFSEYPYGDPTPEACTDGRDNCFQLIGSDAIVPSIGNKVATFNAAVNHEISVDIKCGSMNADVYRNIVTISNNAGRGEIGDRMFNIWQTIDTPGKLLVNVADPTGNFNDSGFYFICAQGEWNTYTLSQRQKSTDPASTVITFTVDGARKHRRTVQTSDVFSGEVFAYAARDNAATAYEVRNFSYQSFEEI